MSITLKAETESYTKASGVAEETIAGVRTVLAFNAQPFEMQRYSKHLDNGRKAGVKKALYMALFSGFFYSTFFVSLAATVYVGVRWYLEARLTAGTLFTVFWCVTYVE